MVTGILVKNDFDHIILDEDEVEKYTALTSSQLIQTQFIPYPYDIQLLNYFLNNFFQKVELEFPSIKDSFDARFRISQTTLDFYAKTSVLKLTWTSSPQNDLVADSISLIILQIK